MKALYVGVATLILTVIMATVIGIGANALLGGYKWVLGAAWKLGLGAAVVLFLAQWFKLMFVDGLDFGLAFVSWVGKILTFLREEWLGTVGIFFVAYFILSTAVGLVVTVDKFRKEAIVLRGMEAVIQAKTAPLEREVTGLRQQVAELEARDLGRVASVADLEHQVKLLADENARLRETVKKASSVAPPRIPAVSRGGEWLRGRDVGVWECTAYTPCVEECDSTPTITATGDRVAPGWTAAADLRHWRAGTEVYVEGFGEVVINDSGSAVKGPQRIDLCVQDKGFARALGRWRARVYVLAEP